MLASFFVIIPEAVLVTEFSSYKCSAAPVFLLY